MNAYTTIQCINKDQLAGKIKTRELLICQFTESVRVLASGMSPFLVAGLLVPLQMYAVWAPFLSILLLSCTFPFLLIVVGLPAVQWFSLVFYSYHELVYSVLKFSTKTLLHLLLLSTIQSNSLCLFNSQLGPWKLLSIH